MKRDLDLIRLLLLEIETRDEAFGSESIRIPEFDSKQIAYNVGLLAQSGFLDVSALHNGLGGGQSSYVIKGMTFHGHDYLDAVRKSKIWQRVKDTAAQAGVSMTIEVAKIAAVSVARQVLGLSDGKA